MKKLIIILIIAANLLSACSSKIEQTSVIPFQAINNLPATTFAINSNQDTLLIGKCGTSLQISKNSFVDENGLAYHGEVFVELKEALDAADIITGNLTTLNDGKLLQTGGMIYLNAKGRDQQLSIAKNHTVKVAIPSKEKMDDMLIYTGVTDSSSNQINWTDPVDIIVKATPYLVNDSITPQYNYSDTLSFNTIHFPKIVEPVKPLAYDNTRDTVLSLVFDTASFPELASYRNVKFKIKNAKNFRATDSQIAWMDVDLKQTKSEGIYDITFRTVLAGVDVMKSYTVCPVFEAGEDYNEAIAEYKKKFEAFESKKKEIDDKRVEAERQQKLMIEEARKKYEESLKIQEQISTDMNYLFEIKNLGWVNCDKLYNNPKMKNVNMFTSIKNQNDYSYINVSMFLKNERMNVPAYQNKSGSFDFSYNGQSIRLPIGSEAIVFATGYKDGNPFYAVSKTTVRNDGNINLSLGTVTLKDVKKILS